MNEANATSNSQAGLPNPSLPRWGWYLFDFANSILIINGGLYFPEWITKENGVSDFWFNATILLSSALVLLTAPIFGHLFDRRGGRLSYLFITSLMMFGGGLTISFAGMFLHDWNWRSCLSLVAFGTILYAYQLSLVFYNVLLGRVSLPNKRAAVSGYGLAWGWIGGIFAIFAIFPFVQGHVPYFQPAGRIQAILPSTLLYAAMTSVSLWLLRKDPSFQTSSFKGKGKGVWIALFQTLKLLPKIRPLFLFIISYFLFSDAILTIQNNSTIFMGSVFNLSTNNQAMVYVVFLTLSAAGALFSAWLMKRCEFKKVLLVSLFMWLALIVATLYVALPILGAMLLSIMGFANGMLWNVSRVWFYELAPANARGELFGYYTALEKVATFLGPLFWSASLVLIPVKAPMNYKFALAAMGVLVLLSLFPLKMIKRDSLNKDTLNKESC